MSQTNYLPTIGAKQERKLEGRELKAQLRPILQARYLPETHRRRSSYRASQIGSHQVSAMLDTEAALSDINLQRDNLTWRAPWCPFDNLPHTSGNVRDAGYAIRPLPKQPFRESWTRHWRRLPTARATWMTPTLTHHLRHLRVTFERLDLARLQLRPDKCHLGFSSL